MCCLFCFFFFTQLLQPGARGCWCWRFHFTPVRWPLFFQAPKRFRLGGAGALAGLPWIPPPLARALPGSTNFVGTNAQAHLLVMSLNVAKCNLGKVNLEAMLVSSFPSYTRGGPMPLAGAPRDLYMQLLACSSSQSVVAIACCLHASLLWFFPSLPPSWCGLGKYWVGKYSTELFSVTVPGGGRLQGCHGYLLLMLEHCPAPPTL